MYFFTRELVVSLRAVVETNFFNFSQAENVILGTLFINLQPKTKNEIYAAILPPSLNIFYTTGQQLNSLLKKSLHSLVSIAFSTYTELQDRIPEYEECIRIKSGRKENELGELIHAFRGTCLSSLPEFIDDTKVCFLFVLCNEMRYHLLIFFFLLTGLGI